ncbi:MAG: NAD(P)-dependent dehydrogenase (short-subunit alcohol dehydrogenase family) [Bacteroidia bacterium]|jgi:NAD(P)-dependent dehydrogenase (short-subunit alcohol dehydrogenase family)
MIRVFAKERAGLGIRCNARLPGLTKIQFSGALFTDYAIREAAVQGIPMQRHG